MARDTSDNIFGVVVAEGQEGPPLLLSEREQNELRALLALPGDEALGGLLKQTSRYVPADPIHAWRDSYVQACTGRFLREVVLPKWIKNHPHPHCSGIRVDNWGRLLCRYINPNNGIDGPWENPTHFVFYYYNTYGAFLEYGITLKVFLKDFCDVALP